MLKLGGGMTGKKLEEAVARAQRFPLGSEKNPVRENGPEGERAYLGRLRCADGSTPRFDRAGNVGEGPYRFIVDVDAVACPGQAPVQVYLDMYHDGGETQPVPGFTFVD